MDPFMTNYQLGKTLGIGTLGKVKIAKHTETGETLAIKIYNKRKAVNLDMLQQIKMEIATMKLLKHPNVVRLYEVIGTPSDIYVILEYLRGGNLLDKIVEHGRMNEDEARYYFQQLINAVDYCHSRGVYHRDLKPKNLLLDASGNLKVTDFVWSALAQQVEANGLLHTKGGTTNYAAPEVLSDKGYDGAAADLWSCGVILFELLAGYMPFDDSNRMNLLGRIKAAEFTCPSWLSLDTKRLIHRLLDPDRSTRITLPELLNDEWFKKDFKQPEFMEKEETNFDDVEAAFQVSEEEVGASLLAHKAALQFLEGIQNYRLEEILSATNNFSGGNLITEGRLGKVYKGQRLQYGNLVNFSVRRLDRKYGQGDEFETEISMLKSLQHKNIVSFFWLCDEDNEKIIIYKQSVHGTLDQHLNDPTLTWSRRLQICLGVANALNYIHYDLIHCDISSSKIFLDNNWEPKMYGFELSTKYPQSWRHRLLFFRYFGNINMTPKYDVCSFGVLLFEVLCGRKPTITNEGVQDELDKIINPNLRKQMDTQSLELFTDITYKCLNQQLVQRPTMDHIVKELEEVLELQLKHANLEHSIAADGGTSSNNSKIEFLKIPLREIRRATNDFDEAGSVGCGGYGIVYKANLDVLDIQSLSSLEGKCKDELRKINKTVAIKRIFSREDEQETQGKRPTMEVIIKELQNALNLQGDTMELSRFELSDIVLATENFAETYCIGVDSNGMVYKAELEHFGNDSSLETQGKDNGEPSKKRITVAIKRITSRKGVQGKEGFFSELEMRARYKHPNIVSLLGFCDEGDEMILVYEHASKGSLGDCLKNVGNMNNLTWTHRLQLCLEIARGLDHLHTKMDILHGDISSPNILLDKNKAAKIAYFGISKLHPTNQEAGVKVFRDPEYETTDPGYETWDPEYETTGELKRESDVFSFGVVLFEIFSWKLAYDPGYVVVNDKRLARQSINIDGMIQRLIDPKLKEETDKITSNGGPDKGSLYAFFKVACRCVGEASQLPTMATVIKELERALHLHNKSTNPDENKE
ncbi:putative protein kinase CAMK-CAMKL-CHK1 family [Helianthus annuus]|nr:putative protein kinase CAMK-CAMKL-CHK1 family [Helianthus annuus]